MWRLACSGNEATDILVDAFNQNIKVSFQERVFMLNFDSRWRFQSPGTIMPDVLEDILVEVTGLGTAEWSATYFWKLS
jgi:hypothetical protein